MVCMETSSCTVGQSSSALPAHTLPISQSASIMSATQPTPHKLFIQMSGAPGSGKSTLARLLGRSIGGVVIDHDTLRSTLLESNLPFAQAAKTAYQLQWKIARDILEQGLSVIIDSTCNFQEVLDRGQACASEYDYAYWYVECKVDDIDLLDRRLRGRVSMISQRRGVDCPPSNAAVAEGAGGDKDSRALFQRWIHCPCRPDHGNVVIVDSTQDTEMLRKLVLERITG